MRSKKILMPLLLAGTFMMASCSSDTVVARPGWQNDPIIDSIDVKDNTMKVIYDAVKALGDTNANVLNKILVDISTKHIGDVKSLRKISEKESFKDAKTLVANFMSDSNHKFYKPLDNYKVVNNKKEELTENESLEISYELIKAQYKEIVENIYEKLYNEIKGGTYSTDNIFYEERFVQSMIKNLYYTPTGSETYKEEQMILARKVVGGELESWEDTVARYLTITKGENPLNNKYYGKYIEYKILPELYKTYLIENYVKEQRYSSLGRTYARRVNSITIAKGSYPERILDLVNEYAKLFIAKNEIAPYYDFTYLEDSLKGFNVSLEEEITATRNGLLDAAKFEFVRSETATGTPGQPIIWSVRTNPNGTAKKDQATPKTQLTYVYKGTKLGDLVEKYLKIFDVKVEGTETTATQFVRKTKIDDAAYKDLTNSGAHSIEDGLVLKEREIRSTTYVKNGWFVKNGGLSDMNATFRDRLFNIQTSSLVDSDAAKSKYTPGDYVRYYKLGPTENNTSRAFLTMTKDTSTTEKDEKSIVIDDGSNYMICEVMEAASTSKLSLTADSGSYRHIIKGDSKIASTLQMNKIVNEVVKTVSSGDTYKANANQYYLMISNIIIHDQSVYDYFKSQYPDLFK